MTRDRGGSIGGIRASQLPSEYLDAIERLRVGETSEVFSTALGFHIIHWRAPPSDVNVAGQRIVIRYESTGGIASPPRRTRAEAEALATTVAAAAQPGERDFDALVAEFSEGIDRDAKGDMGVWSSRDPASSPREVEELTKLKLNEVSSPLDSYWGFQVIKRIDVRPRKPYAMEAVRIGFNPSATPPDVVSREVARKGAEKMLAALLKDPSKLQKFQHETGSPPAEQWSAGRAPPILTRTVATLKFGETAPRLVEVPEQYLIVRRMDPTTLPQPRPPLFFLPRPDKPDLERLVATIEPRSLAEFSKLLATQVSATETLADANERQLIVNELRGLADKFEGADTAEARVIQLKQMLLRLESSLAPTTYRNTLTFINLTVEKDLVD